ncbi:MAG: hypothetical protein HXY24_18930, partial [Rubrivivax sp.]|nr:hypothetical protein [Rubrivivax sp.]
DPGGRLAEQCLDEPATWPFAVVTDGAGVVRAIARRGQPRVGELLQSIEESAADAPLERSRSRVIVHGRRLLDRRIQTLSGAVRLSDLWQSGPLVVVFVDPA